MTRLPCPPELWPQFSALLDEALDLPAEDRSAWLQGLGEEHAEVLPWLEKMLNPGVSAPPSNFLDRPLLTVGAGPEFAAGQSVGPYVLERKLGQGGMSEVWLAVRNDGVPNRHVALKIPYASMLSGVLRVRFERERDILAELEHPHIAPLYEAGISSLGYPYLAMEWVDGSPLTAYCDEHQLTVKQRLMLYLQVLDAVRHAHARLILHRDIKPSNILVTQNGQVKLLDFGIAKLLASEGESSETELTQVGGRPMTPDYAAPEQLARQPLSTAVDVYSLGVVLYELLTGRRPFDALNTRSGGHFGARPSDVPLAASRVVREHAARVGGLDVTSLRRALGGDIEAILAKALAPEPAQRYRSVEAFTADIFRHLRDLPISARHVGPLTRAWKFAHRNQAGTSFGIALCLALAVGVGAMRWQRQVAEHQVQRATIVRDFLVGMFNIHEPRLAGQRPYGNITAKELLDLNTGRIERDFARDPETAIEMLGITASIYQAFGDEDHFHHFHERQVEMATDRYGEMDPLVIRGRLDDAYEAYVKGQADRAAIIMKDVDRRLRGADLDRSALRAIWWLYQSRLLAIHKSTSDVATQACIDALDRSIALFARYGRGEPAYSDALTERGDYFIDIEAYDAARDYLNRALATYDEGQRHDETNRIAIYQRLALIHQHLGDVAGAEAAYQQAADAADRTRGPRDQVYWFAVAQRARLAHWLGDRPRADQMFQRLMNHLPAVDDSSQDALVRDAASYARQLYGRSLISEGRPELAIPLLKDSLRGLGEKAPSDSNHLKVMLDLADAYERAGQSDEADEWFRRLRALSSDLDADSVDALEIQGHWGWHLLNQGNRAAAAQQIASALHVIEKMPKMPRIAVPILVTQARLNLAHGDVAEALRNCEQATAIFAGIPDLQDARIAVRVRQVYAEALVAAGRLAEAKTVAEEVVSAFQRYNDPSSAELVQAQRTLQNITTKQET